MSSSQVYKTMRLVEAEQPWFCTHVELSLWNGTALIYQLHPIFNFLSSWTIISTAFRGGGHSELAWLAGLDTQNREPIAWKIDWKCFRILGGFISGNDPKDISQYHLTQDHYTTLSRKAMEVHECTWIFIEKALIFVIIHVLYFKSWNFIDFHLNPSLTTNGNEWFVWVQVK